MADKIEVTSVNAEQVTLAVRNEAEDAVILDRSALLHLIQQLGQSYATMLGDEPSPPLQGTQVTVLAGSEWYVQPVELGTIFSFWHRGFGPVGLFLEPHDAERLHDLLGQQIEARRRPSTPGH